MLEDKRTHTLAGFTALAIQHGLISAYYTTIADVDSKKRCADKLDLVNGIDLYEILRRNYGKITLTYMHVHVCMYLHDCLQAPTLKKACSATRVRTATRTLCEDG